MNLSFEPAITPEQARRCHEAVGELDAYLRALIRERRSQPCEDILSVLIAAEVDGDRLTEAEIVGNTALLLSAGYETTMADRQGHPLAPAISCGDRPAWPASRAGAENAVEEFMRHESPVQFTARQPRVDVEIRGRRIAAGEHCLMIVAAANRDPDHFSDPDRLDVGRENASDQISFGGGRHFCLGAPLARLEGAIAFSKLVPLLLGDAELTTPSLEWRDSFLNHALESLPVRLARASRHTAAS
jgi:hypothetical protein